MCKYFVSIHSKTWLVEGKTWIIRKFDFKKFCHSILFSSRFSTCIFLGLFYHIIITKLKSRMLRSRIWYFPSRQQNSLFIFSRIKIRRIFVRFLTHAVDFINGIISLKSSWTQRVIFVFDCVSHKLADENCSFY